MRVMALDVGTKRIGIALSDPLKITAQGLTTFNRTTQEEDIRGLWDLIHEHEVSQLVVGLPKNMDGTIGFKAEEIKAFVEELTAVEKIEVIWIDERLTTVSAERALLEADVSRSKRKKVIDKMAATIILQSYLDRI